MEQERQVIVTEEDIAKAWELSRLKYELDESHKHSVWRKQGFAQGYAEGQKIASIEVAKKLLADEVPINLISEATKLSESELRAIQAEIRNSHNIS